jgi:hypothetical protein
MPARAPAASFAARTRERLVDRDDVAEPLGQRLRDDDRRSADRGVMFSSVDVIACERGVTRRPASRSDRWISG